MLHSVRARLILFNFARFLVRKAVLIVGRKSPHFTLSRDSVTSAPRVRRRLQQNPRQHCGKSEGKGRDFARLPSQTEICSAAADVDLVSTHLLFSPVCRWSSEVSTWVISFRATSRYAIPINSLFADGIEREQTADIVCRNPKSESASVD